MTAPSAHLRVHDLRVIFSPHRVVWQDVSFEITPGTITAIVGSNGSGKTTLLRCMAGLQSPTCGRVERFVSRTSFLGQADYLYQTATVGENLELVAKLCAVEHAQLLQIAQQWHVHDWWTRPVATLSRGMRARVAFARAWLTSRETQLLDEPFLALDDAGLATVHQNIREFAQQGGSVVIAVQDVNACRDLITHMFEIREQNVVMTSPRP